MLFYITYILFILMVIATITSITLYYKECVDKEVFIFTDIGWAIVIILETFAICD